MSDSFIEQNHESFSRLQAAASSKCCSPEDNLMEQGNIAKEGACHRHDLVYINLKLTTIILYI